ncbi:peptidoglycan D,D-transpeptidase FtsI family protein [Hyphococcus luteus]|uniref:Penicillin-binding protein n=1 Tax=Hyphococcus luteus TaxID=2058213 RepID=A0A2S7K9D9_9PROT|nr:penicillin-binding protein 2 [Marinicaulis flavus]PQA89091.1 penicillin-binding protein [Marinicaulis flavus]
MFQRKHKRAKPQAYVIAEADADEEARGADAGALKVRALGARGRIAERARMRVMMCASVFVFVFAALGVRLAFVSFGGLGSSQTYAAAPRAAAPRAEIVDRNGALLAADLPVIALEVAGRDVWDPEEAARKLAGVLPDIDAAELQAKLEDGRYVEVRADLTPAERQAVFDLGLPGVRFAARVKRFFPQGDLAAHTVGHDEPGKGGVMGLEKVVNRFRGKGPMQASLDIRVQQILEEELADTMEAFEAEAAWGAVMDVKTGEVVALASLPDFDPNAPGAYPADSRRNRATYDRYELGSAFKSFTAAAVIEDGLGDETTTYDARGSFKVADRRITDFHGENRILTLSEVVQHSSNIGAARMALDLGAKEQQRFLEALGLFAPLPIELAENRAPELPYQWGPVETATISYGHGIAVTPLHLLAAYCAVVNGGVYRAPTFLAGTKDEEGRQVFSPETSAAMRRILRRVVTDGTASYAEAPGYYPIGKTATADKQSASGGYQDNARIASFVGAVPGYAPRYAILISFDNPQPQEGTYGYATAGWNAAPAFSRFVERAAPLLGLSTVNEATALASFVSGEPPALQRQAKLSRKAGSEAGRGKISGGNISGGGAP